MGKHNGTPDAEPMEHDIHDNDDIGIFEELKKIASNDPAKKKKKKNSKKLKSKCGSFPVTRKEEKKKTKTKSKSLRIVRGTTPPPSDEPDLISRLGIPSKKKRERSKSVQISSHDELRRVRDGTDELSSSGDPLKDEEEAYADDEGKQPIPLVLPSKKKSSKSPTTKPKTPRPGSSSLSFSAIIPSSPRKRRPSSDLGDAFQEEKERQKEKQKEKEREKEQEKERESDLSEPEHFLLTADNLSRHMAHAELLQSCPVTPTRPSSVMSMRGSDSESDLLSGYSSDVKQKLRTKFWADAIEDTRQDKGVSGQPPCTNLNIVNRLFGQFFADKANIFAGFLAFVLVTPYTIITPMSLYYQLYLNEIFHTTFISRSAHFLLMPAITWVQLTMAAHFEWSLSSTPVESTPTGIINGREIDLFAVNGAFYLACLFLFWWITWGFVTKTYCFGFFVIPHLFVLYVTANLFHYMTCYPPEIATWYAPAPLWANPFVIGFILAFLQAASHYQEPLPPRVNLTPHWQPLNQWIDSYSKEVGLWKTFSLIAFQFMTGTVNEFCAGPRLFPLLVLKQMHMLGYKREQWKHLVRLVKWARKHNDPALDYIGRGGALPADEQRVPETPEEAKEELASLRGKEDPASKLRKSFLVQLLAKARLNQLALRPFSRDRKKKFPEVSPAAEEDDQDQSDSSESEGAPDNKPLVHTGDKDFAKMLHLVRKDVRSVEKHRKYLRQSSAAAYIAARSPLLVRKTNN